MASECRSRYIRWGLDANGEACHPDRSPAMIQFNCGVLSALCIRCAGNESDGEVEGSGLLACQTTGSQPLAAPTLGRGRHKTTSPYAFASFLLVAHENWQDSGCLLPFAACPHCA